MTEREAVWWAVSLAVFGILVAFGIAVAIASLSDGLIAMGQLL